VAAVAGLGGGPTLLGRRDERQVRELSAAAFPAAPGQRLGQQRLIWSVPTVRPLAALTFDDGPDPELTPRILKVLAEHGVQVTFVEPRSGALVLVGPAIIGQPASRGVGNPFLIYHRGRAVFTQNNTIAS
jgi:Polysaccharide deacetylase